MRRFQYIAISLLFSFVTTAFAQELSVVSFQEVTNDLSARTNVRSDLNDRPCALVKVELPLPGVQFDQQRQVVGNVDYKVNTYWAYVPAGTKHLTLSHPQFHSLDVIFSNYGVPYLLEQTTYLLRVNVPVNIPIQEVKIQTGWIILDSDPQGASVYINNEFVGNTPLDSYKQPYGTYTYRVEKPNYHGESGTLVLNSSKYEKTITLTPAFGSIAIAANVSGVDVLLDGKNTGKKSPCTLTEIPSGNHTVSLQKDKYAPAQYNVKVEDGKTTNVTGNLDARFASISIKSLPGANILIDNLKKGNSSCTLDLMEGYYDIEVQLAHHKKATKQIQVVAGQSQTITLNPTPIYGSLDITSTPRNAKIMVDGKPYGQTPNTIENLLEGTHNVALSLDGYATETKQVTIQENKTTTLAATLQVGRSTPVSTQQSGVSVSRDGDKLTFTINGVSFTMIQVEGGSFMRGYASTPVHKVTLSSYYIGETEVTNELWRAVMVKGGFCDPKEKNYPAVHISWNACHEFITKLNRLCASQLDGMCFALPTEAQWEYAARGGNRSNGYQFSGSNKSKDVAWYKKKGAHPVKLKQPNELGIYDMSGNVEEWCQDYFGDYSSEPQTDPKGPKTGELRVLRGGAYLFGDYSCRVSCRSRERSGFHSSYIGLRLACVPSPDGVAPSSQHANTQEKTNSTKAPDANLTFTVKGVSFNMIYVEGGTFTMGWNEILGDNYAPGANPTHSVTLSTYYMAETEVTQALWEAVIGNYNPNNKKGDNYPLERVTYDDCKIFISKLNNLCASQLNGKRFAMPTEAQWEYAARGGKKSRDYIYSGSNSVDSVAWYDKNSGDESHPVKTKQPNELGLYDMSGNVAEWCQDWYSEYSSKPQTNPQGPNSGSERVVRGYMFSATEGVMEIPKRGSVPPSIFNKYIGLRLVCIP